MSGELLLELLSEEIPARMQRRAIDDLVGLIAEKLKSAEIPPQSIARYVTPRRLTVIANGIPLTQPEREEERRGPRIGAPEAAVAGFLRAAGLASLDQCEVRDTGRGEFYFAVIRHQGRTTREVLPELLLAAINELPWPKSMRFPAAPLRWVRPLNSVICLFDGEVVPVALGQVPVGRATQGHRVLAPGKIEVVAAADYRTRLAAANVVLDAAERRHLVETGLAKAAAALGAAVKPDPGLLDEVTGLAEFPVVLSGRIDPAFMDLPPEVLATAMRTHQKYFSCLKPDGSPAPHFLFVANNRTQDGGTAISAGNERVLRARLSDARFFWDQDRKVRLEDRVAALKDRVFHAKLGSVHDKVERVEKLAAYLADALAASVAPASSSVAPAKAGAQSGGTPLALGSRFRGNDGVRELATRAARLAKADLSTGMVGEFPELQGVMGRYYALNDGEDPQVADAVADHYKPLGPNDSCPTAPVSVILALADKIDTLAAFFAIGEPPTGSRDPFALRRAALGLVRIIVDGSLCIALRGPLLGATVFLTGAGQGPVVDAVLDFIADRLKVHLREQGVRHDLIAAVFALDEDDLVRLLARVEALGDFLASESGANLLTAYRRAANIVAIEERRDGCTYDGDPDATLLELFPERSLDRTLSAVGGVVAEAVKRERYAEAMVELAQLRDPVDDFFDKVTVNAEDPKLRANRLRLLSRIRSVMNQVADFSQIEG